MVAFPVSTPSFQYALVSCSNAYIRGNNTVIDSFDSSDPLYSTGGLYDSSSARPTGTWPQIKLFKSRLLKAYNIYGHLTTGYGTAETNVGLPPQAAIGDFFWNTLNSGIEPGYWTNNFLMTFPDVPAPAASASLPAASNGIINLNSGAYLATSDPGFQININGPVTLWVTTSYSPNILINTNYTNASLTLYVGANSGSAVSLSLGGNGNLNYAARQSRKSSNLRPANSDEHSLYRKHDIRRHDLRAGSHGFRRWWWQ